MYVLWEKEAIRIASKLKKTYQKNNAFMFIVDYNFRTLYLPSSSADLL